jgi:predicted oxidoreductase
MKAEENKNWEEEARKNRKEVLKYRKDLKELVTLIDAALTAIDVEMKKPSTMERGKKIARICNALEFKKDEVRFFTLGEKLNLKKVRKKIKDES